MARHRHLNLTPLDELRGRTVAAVGALATRELLPVEQALGRITAEAVPARVSVPHYHAAAMDGIAVRAVDTAGASETRPIELELGTPASATRPFSYVETGNAVPAWADAVVMIERVSSGAVSGGPARHEQTASVAGSAGADDDCCASEAAGEAAVSSAGGAPSGNEEASAAADRARVVHVRAAAEAWQHVRLVGEDVIASDHLLPRGHEIRPYDVAALLAAGIVEIAVRPRPVVAILPTGDELIEPGAARGPGRIVEFNSRMIAGFVSEWGAEPLRLAPVGDNLDAIRSRLAIAVREADVVCVIAGSSAGEHDFTAAALSTFGEVLAHGVAVMPGKPAIVATIAAHDDSDDRRAVRARLALGIPGYPVSAAVICRELLEPVLARLLGRPSRAPVTVRAITPRALVSRLGQAELVRVTLGRIGGRVLLAPLARSAGAITTMVRADGFVRLGPEVDAVPAGSEVEVELLRPLDEVLATIVVAGSDDPVLGLLEDAIRTVAPRHRLAPSTVGSRAGVMALLRGEAHAAAFCGPSEASTASDLVAELEPRDARPLVAVHLVTRDVGLVVAPGNPLGLRAVADLVRDDVRTPPEVRRAAVRFLNRGGDRDSHRHGDAAEVEEQELTPAAVAIAVQSGLADAGLGTAATAAALGLGFVPVLREDYGLLLDAAWATSDAGTLLRAAARSDAFRAAVGARAGYDASRSGAEQDVPARSRAAAALRPVTR